MERAEVKEQNVNGGIDAGDLWSHHTGNFKEKLKPREEH